MTPGVRSESDAGPPESFTYGISSDHVVAHVRLVGSLTAGTNVRLGQLLSGLIRGGHRELMLDLADVTRVSPICVGVLNRTLAELRVMGGGVTLTEVAASDAATLRGAGLDPRVVIEAAEGSTPTVPPVPTG